MNENFASRWCCCKKAWKRYKKAQRELVRFDAQRKRFEATLKDGASLPLDLQRDPTGILRDSGERGDLWKQHRKNLEKDERQQRDAYIRATHSMLLCHRRSN